MNTPSFLQHACQWIGKLRARNGFYTPKKLTGPCDMGGHLTPSYNGGSICTPNLPSDGDLMLGKLMLVVTEVSEAAECVRDGDLVHFSEEIADVYIRLNDIVDALGIDIESEITKKMEKNEKRPPKHGRLTNL